MEPLFSRRADCHMEPDVRKPNTRGDDRNSRDDGPVTNIDKLTYFLVGHISHTPE